MGLWGQVDNIVEYWGRKQYWSHGYQDAKVLIRDTAMFERRVSHMWLTYRLLAGIPSRIHVKYEKALRFCIV